MATMMTTDQQLPSEALREKFKTLRELGLKDMKFWFMGSPSEDVSTEALCEEVISILDAKEKGRFVDIKDKLK